MTATLADNFAEDAETAFGVYLANLAQIAIDATKGDAPAATALMIGGLLPFTIQQVTMNAALNLRMAAPDGEAGKDDRVSRMLLSEIYRQVAEGYETAWSADIQGVLDETRPTARIVPDISDRVMVFWGKMT